MLGQSEDERELHSAYKISMIHNAININYLFAEILFLTCFCSKLFYDYIEFSLVKPKTLLLSYILQRTDEILNLTHEHEIICRDSFHKIIVCNVINKE